MCLFVLDMYLTKAKMFGADKAIQITCGFRLEELLRGSTHWRVQKFEDGHQVKIIKIMSDVNAVKARGPKRAMPSQGVWGMLLSFTSADETFHVRSTDMSITSNKSMS